MVSDLGLHGLPMSHTKDTKLIILWLKIYSKTYVKWPVKHRQTKILMTNGSLMKVISIMLQGNEGRKYCRMLPLEHSAILLTFIKR